MADNRFLPKLSQNLLEILDNDDEYYDITIEVGNDPYAKIFRAHMVILSYRSTYLRRILSTNKKNDGASLVHIKLPNISPEIFQIILRYIYRGKISFKEYDALDIINILIAANEFGLQELIPYLQSFLIRNKSNWIKQNFSLVYQISFKNNSFMELQKLCSELISKEPEKIFESPDFISISEECLISLIQSDKLQMNEIQVWEHVLKWGFARNPELSSDNLASFSRNNFNALKNTLWKCIPFVRFYNLTSKEFLNKVYPYKKILPGVLLDDLIEYFLDNDSNPINKLKTNDIETQRIEEKDRSNNVIVNNVIVIDSKIITNQHAELILTWIKKIKITDKIRNSFKFKLIFRASHNGFNVRKFRRICDKRSKTVSIFKSKYSNEIIGGYNPIEWNSDSLLGRYDTTKDSFIFSFTDEGNTIKDYVLSRIVDENHAIYNSQDYGPSFGYSDLITQNYSDIIQVDRNVHGYCKKSSHEKPIRKTKDKFIAEEFEVFQIVEG